jgi:hypothetical protein
MGCPFSLGREDARENLYRQVRQISVIRKEIVEEKAFFIPQTQRILSLGSTPATISKYR